MNYYVIVLPMALDGSVNRQMYAYADYEEAKQAFHFNCGKYFKNASLKQASVVVIDDLTNKLMDDYWKAPEVEEVTE